MGALAIAPTLRAGMQFVALCVKQRFCRFSDFSIWLKAPFRPSASYFDEAKVTKAFRSCFRPDFVGFLRPVTYVAPCVVSTIVVEKRFRAIGLKARLGN